MSPLGLVPCRAALARERERARAALICAVRACVSISHAGLACVRVCAGARASRCDVARARRSMCTRVCVGASAFACLRVRARVRVCVRLSVRVRVRARAGL